MFGRVYMFSRMVAGSFCLGGCVGERSRDDEARLRKTVVVKHVLTFHWWNRPEAVRIDAGRLIYNRKLIEVY
jgi:hypothetical protein